jgi:hypothetical protein
MLLIPQIGITGRALLRDRWGGKAFRIYFSVRTDALSKRPFLFAALDVLGHPSWIR